MNNKRKAKLFFCLFLISWVGCQAKEKPVSEQEQAEKKADSWNKAIAQPTDWVKTMNQAQGYQNRDEKVRFLLNKGEYFFKRRRYEDAIQIGSYILNAIDRQNKEAQDLVVKARAAINKLKAQNKLPLNNQL